MSGLGDHSPRAMRSDRARGGDFLELGSWEIYDSI